VWRYRSCVLALGFWVALVRIRDIQAWLLLVLLLSFAEMFGGNSSGYAGLSGREDTLQPAFGTYHVLLANLAPSALMLFAVYFPERLELDRRIPWAKWLVVVSLVFKVATDTATFALFLHHLAMARELRAVLGSLADELSWLQLAALILFFVILGYKTFSARGRDPRRRLLLLDTAAAVNVTPIVLWLILRDRLPEWTTLAAIVLWFLFPLTMAYVIVVHRAMDVRVAIRQGVRYLLATGGVRVFQAIVSVMIIVVAASISADPNANLIRRVGVPLPGFQLFEIGQMYPIPASI
jgi:phosphoserine phosphatase RsbU/P